jgi:hypothetical protein
MKSLIILFIRGLPRSSSPNTPSPAAGIREIQGRFRIDFGRGNISEKDHDFARFGTSQPSKYCILALTGVKFSANSETVYFGRRMVIF